LELRAQKDKVVHIVHDLKNNEFLLFQ
jgi:hypothetical protein